MKSYKSNNYVPSLVEQKLNYLSIENIVNSLTDVKKDISGSYNKIKNNIGVIYYNHLLKEEIKGTFENLKHQPLKKIALITGGAAAIVAYAPEIEKAINSYSQNFSIGSQVVAAETKTNVLDYFHNALNSRDEKIAEKREQTILENYLSNNLPKNFSIVDLERRKQIRKNYDFSKVSKENLDDKLLQTLNLNPDMKLSYDMFNVKGEKVTAYNIIDSDNINDGIISVSNLGEGRVRVLFDELNKSDINLITSGLKTYDISAIMSDILKSKANNCNLYRISDGETTFGFVLAPKKLAIEEILKEYGKYNGAILGSASIEHEKKESVIPTPPDEEEQEEQEETGPTPEPSLQQELNNDNDPVDPVITGSDPNTGDGSTQTNPVVNPDPDPHIV